MGKVTFATAFQTPPVHALWRGEPVRIIAIGDVDGLSPSYLFIDGKGMSRWAGIGELRVVDPNCLPTAAELVPV